MTEDTSLREKVLRDEIPEDVMKLVREAYDAPVRDDGSSLVGLVPQAAEDDVKLAIARAILSASEAKDRRIEALEAAAGKAHSALAVMISPGAIQQTTVINAYAMAVEAEAALRAARSGKEGQS